MPQMEGKPSQTQTTFLSMPQIINALSEAAFEKRYKFQLENIRDLVGFLQASFDETRRLLGYGGTEKEGFNG